MGLGPQLMFRHRASGGKKLIKSKKRPLQCLFVWVFGVKCSGGDTEQSWADWPTYYLWSNLSIKCMNQITALMITLFQRIAIRGWETVFFQQTLFAWMSFKIGWRRFLSIIILTIKLCRKHDVDLSKVGWAALMRYIYGRSICHWQTINDESINTWICISLINSSQWHSHHELFWLKIML